MRDVALFRDEILRRCRGVLREKEALSAHTSLKIGGEVELWFEPQEETSLAVALELAQRWRTPVYIVGGGSNILLPEGVLQGLCLHLGQEHFQKIRLVGNEVIAGAGVALPRLLAFLVKEGFGDCEFLLGVPAEVGGAIMMNAGSSDRWIGSYVNEIRGMSFSGRQGVYQREELRFSYRESGLKDFVITEARLGFPLVAPSETLRRMNAYADYRRRTQDLKLPSAGCMFRNPPAETSAGELIERAGLKGVRVGGAQVSLVHANFVVNRGDATQTDVLILLELVEKTVYEKLKVHLEREIKVIT